MGEFNLEALLQNLYIAGERGDYYGAEIIMKMIEDEFEYLSDNLSF